MVRMKLILLQFSFAISINSAWDIKSLCSRKSCSVIVGSTAAT